MKRIQFTWLCLLLLALLSTASEARADAGKPNIVLILMDNLGWGEIGAYGGGIIRGAPTPRIDSLADDGMKLLNFRPWRSPRHAGFLSSAILPPEGE